MIDRLLSIIAPHICCSCGHENAILCENCFFDITDEPFSQCVDCMQPTVDGNLCRRCETHGPIKNLWVVGNRTGAVKKLIDLYKFEHNREAATRIASLLDARLPQLPAGTVVCFIPDIPAHRRKRGLDHMSVIATEFAKLRLLKTLPLLQRQTFHSQRGLSKAQRLQQQDGAFLVNQSPDIENCLVLDDVYTTGATVRAAAKALRDAGIENIYVGLVARQPLDEQADL